MWCVTQMLEHGQASKGPQSTGSERLQGCRVKQCKLCAHYRIESEWNQNFWFSYSRDRNLWTLTDICTNVVAKKPNIITSLNSMLWFTSFVKTLVVSLKKKVFFCLCFISVSFDERHSPPKPLQVNLHLAWQTDASQVASYCTTMLTEAGRTGKTI